MDSSGPIPSEGPAAPGSERVPQTAHLLCGRSDRGRAAAHDPLSLMRRGTLGPPQETLVRHGQRLLPAEAHRRWCADPCRALAPANSDRQSGRGPHGAWGEVGPRTQAPVRASAEMLSIPDSCLCMPTFAEFATGPTKSFEPVWTPLTTGSYIIFRACIRAGVPLAIRPAAAAPELGLDRDFVPPRGAGGIRHRLAGSSTPLRWMTS